MIRTQIQLTKEQSRYLKHLAVNRGVSVAELIRQSIDMLIKTRTEVDEKERIKRAINAAGRYKSGKRDVSVNHDKYLLETFDK